MAWRANGADVVRVGYIVVSFLAMCALAATRTAPDFQPIRFRAWRTDLLQIMMERHPSLVTPVRTGNRPRRAVVTALSRKPAYHVRNPGSLGLPGRCGHAPRTPP